MVATMGTSISYKERHFLQSEEWELFQKSLGNKTFRKTGQGWSYLAVLEKGRMGSPRRLYVPYGPTVEDQQSLEAAINDLRNLSEKLKVAYIRYEPVVIGGTQIAPAVSGAIKTTRDSQPRRTLLIDLQRSIDDVVQDMTKTNRYLWRKYNEGKTSLSIHTTYDIRQLSPFLGMMHETAARNKAIFHDDVYFRKLFECLAPSKVVGLSYALHEGSPVAGIFFFDDIAAKRRYYAYAASFFAARDLNANPPLVTSVILDARSSGMEVFDFFGVSAESETDHRWSGFSKFKRSFGGSDYEYYGTYELPVKKLHYKVNNIARKMINARRGTLVS